MANKFKFLLLLFVQLLMMRTLLMMMTMLLTMLTLLMMMSLLKSFNFRLLSTDSKWQQMKKKIKFGKKLNAQGKKRTISRLLSADEEC